MSSTKTGNWQLAKKSCLFPQKTLIIEFSRPEKLVEKSVNSKSRTWWWPSADPAAYSELVTLVNLQVSARGVAKPRGKRLVLWVAAAVFMETVSIDGFILVSVSNKHLGQVT